VDQEVILYVSEHRDCGLVGTLTAMPQNLAPVQKHRPWYEVARVLLKDKGMTYADLADILGVTTGTVGHYMVGRREPTLDQLKTIAKALDKSISELAGEDVYFLVEESEREVIDTWRTLTPDQRALLLGMLKQAGKK
jgi:transcriptional regulator with XRE-family HTH domain